MQMSGICHCSNISLPVILRTKIKAKLNWREDLEDLWRSLTTRVRKQPDFVAGSSCKDVRLDLFENYCDTHTWRVP